MGMLHSSAQQDEYTGPDRRRHRVFITKNSEYHCRDGICVAVRDVHTGAFQPEHAAVGKKMSSSILFSKEGGIAAISKPGETHVGEQLCFSSGQLDHEIITSAVKAIERPPKEIVSRYTH
ncbi:MAG: hypothetical protein JWM74_23 [Myxococcaceae bacterium]|nr:hypothetical protein [Myxococcaceae bacterium]